MYTYVYENWFPGTLIWLRNANWFWRIGQVVRLIGAVRLFGSLE